MSSFFKSIFHSSNKHKKLCEEWTNNREPVADGITFYVRYLGSSLVEDPKSAQSTAAGVKRVIQAAKVKGRRPEKVSFRVAMEGVRIDSTTTGETLMDTSIYKISYCSADSQYAQVLAFVASNEDESCECHAFLCSKRKVAEAIAVSIAQAFTMAYECWKLALEAKRNGRNAVTSEQMSGSGGESPSRLSKGGECSNSSRASSPEHSPGHSSPPSEVSSTSGYMSSTLGGLLLELDYTDAGSDGALAPQLQEPPSGPSRTRKHWIEFGSCDELLPVGSPYGSSGHGLMQLPTRVAGGQQDAPHSPSGCRNGEGAAPLRPRRNCSFNSHYSSSRYSLSDSEQKQLLAAAH